MHTIEIRKATNGQYYARGKGRNGEIMAYTEMYTTKSSALHAAELMQRGGGTITDLAW